MDGPRAVKVFRLLMLALAVLALLGVARTLHAQTPLLVITGDRDAWRAAKAAARARGAGHNAGETRCTVGGTDSVQLWELSHADSAEVAAHEAIHARQLAANCDSVMAVWDLEPALKMEAEAEALCGGMRAANVPVAWWHGRMVRAAVFWARFSTVSYDQALGAYRRWCVLEGQ